MNMKEIWMPMAVLLIVAMLLFGVSFGCRSIEEMKKIQESQQTMALLLPGSKTFSQETYEGDDVHITKVFKGETGYVIEAAAVGYVDDVVAWIGVDNDGHVTGVTMRDIAETYGLGLNAMRDLDFLNQFLGTQGDAVIGESIDAIAGATVTSKAVAKAVNSASGFVSGADVTSSATEW